MRLTCPNCSAQYEVPDDVIPESGRDVQCSNCEQTWFQPKHPDAAKEQPKVVEATVAEPVEDAAETPAEAVPEPDDIAPEPEQAAEDTGNVDPSVANILKEEAAREAELRAQEGSNLESQPDLALDQPEDSKVKPKRPAATATAADAGQKDALPDVETINTGLKSDSGAKSDDAAAEAPRKSGGFLRGFALIVIIGIILLLVYSNATQISEAVPQADPVLKSYVSFVDQARLWLEAQTGGAAQN